MAYFDLVVDLSWHFPQRAEMSWDSGFLVVLLQLMVCLQLCWPPAAVRSSATWWQCFKIKSSPLKGRLELNWPVCFAVCFSTAKLRVEKAALQGLICMWNKAQGFSSSMPVCSKYQVITSHYHSLEYHVLVGLFCGAVNGRSPSLQCLRLSPGVTHIHTFTPCEQPLKDCSGRAAHLSMKDEQHERKAQSCAGEGFANLF